jgi:thiol-disulfide isomerase/thioredoxin
MPQIANTLLAFLALSLALSSWPNECRLENSGQKKGPSLDGATGWLNTAPLTLAGLRGKVVLVDFWTFTCINWRRTLPYIRAWVAKYKEQGLVVIGVHTPEFSFEYKAENVSKAVKDMNIGFPVTIDNQYKIWNSFENQYWPALYLLDAKGKLRYQKFGEGEYEQIERKIQQLLKDLSPENGPGELVALQPEGVEVAADWDNLQSPENFLGYNRTEGFATPKQFVPDKAVRYDPPLQLKLNQWSLDGEWVMGAENVQLRKLGGKIIYRFHARDLHLIMGSTKAENPVKFRVLIDGNPPGTSHGLDVDQNGNGTVTDQRMYQLIRQPGEIKDRELQIELFDPDVEVYDFTFG